MADAGTTPSGNLPVELEGDVNVEFEEAASRQQLSSGESVKTLFGKLRKFLTDLKAVAFSGAYSDLSGVPDLTQYATKAELDTKAEKKLYGNNGLNLGRLAGSTVGFLSSTMGRANAATGGYSFSQGFDNTASGVASFAGGQSSAADGENALAHGYFVKTTKDNEKAFGAYNKSSSDTLFSVGDGTADDARHNAFEITKTGGKLHDKDILTSAHCIQFVPYNMLCCVANDRILLFSNSDAVARGVYFVNNTPNDIVVCALISASAVGPIVQYGYGTNTYPEIQNTGEGREWFVTETIPTSPAMYVMTVPSGKLGYYGVYHTSESAYATIHDIRCPYFNYF